MKPEMERVKSDVETMQKAMGLAPAMGREWLRWVRRDNWLNLWWGLPGVILIASSFLPAGSTERFFGLALVQWTGGFHAHHPGVQHSENDGRRWPPPKPGSGI
jgi:hypothetical protein